MAAEIVFEPSGRHVPLKAGESILEAARRSGVGITAVCGGGGTCGKCRVRLESGAAAPPTVTEQHILRPEELAKLVKMEAKQIEAWGLYAMVYTYTNFADTALALHELTDFDLWIADYRGKRPTRKHGMWQYTSKGSVPGVKNGVDLSHAYKDYPSILKRAGLTRMKEA